MLLLPIEYKNLSDFIFNYLENTKLLYGSRSYGWISYELEEHSLQLNICRRPACIPGKVTNLYQVQGPTWLLEKTIQWPKSEKDLSLRWVTNTTWNGHIISTDAIWQGMGTDIVVEFAGDLEDFKDTITFLYLQNYQS